MAYKIELSTAARKDLGKLPRATQERLAKSIDSLAEQPRPNGSTKLSGQDLYRVRCGDYLVIYRIEDNLLLVLVVKIVHRSDIYR
jgi:mRNA interferase RelE/StbE